MLNWVTSQATFVIGVIALAFCYLMGLAAFATVELAKRRGHRVALKAVSPVTLTPLAVVFGLLMAFLAADVWPNFDRARTFVGQEATQLSEVLVFADALRPEIRLLVRREIRDHVRNTVEREWPAMASGRATLRELPPPLVAALGSILAMNPEHAGQRLAQQHAVGAIGKALEARRQRILLSRMSVGGVKWLVLTVLAALLLVTIAMIHVDSLLTTAVSLAIFATAAGFSMLLILAYDRPFATGGVQVGPAPLQEVLTD